MYCIRNAEVMAHCRTGVVNCSQHLLAQDIEMEIGTALSAVNCGSAYSWMGHLTSSQCNNDNIVPLEV